MKRLMIIMTLILFGLIRLQVQTKRKLGTVTSFADSTTTAGFAVQVKETTVGPVTDASGK